VVVETIKALLLLAVLLVQVAVVRAVLWLVEA